MSTGVIVAIVVAALILIGLVIALIARSRSQERALIQRRTEAAAARRDQAERRDREAEHAEHRARLAQAEADRHRAEARLRSEQAEAYEHGLADDRLGEDEQEVREQPDGELKDGGARRNPPGVAEDQRTADRTVAGDEARR